ncbi:response regulator [Horticoccus luteus]|uniref:Response regulator n=1 Tax=Horticoccus luteus TaxID=2862869 RepID=A0A8F9XFZ8_9BACT|nr:response regulator [Horticoccus luteus]QYM77665.1 response regulator [Horticoccus luteus]
MTLPGPLLIVDDESHVRKFLQILVRQLGITHCLEAANGEEALEIYARERPAVVLLDISMPVLDGLATLQRLREIDPDAIVVMLTSMTNRQSVEEALRHGAANYIRKDTPKEEVMTALRETLEEYFPSQPSSP